MSQKGPPFYIFRYFATFFERIFFSKITSFFPKNVLRFLSLRYGADFRRSRLVLFYNKNKVGVDAMDQMIRAYSTRTASRRWTFAVFCNILDKFIINCWIIYKKITQTKISRRDFICELFIELTTMYNPEPNRFESCH